MEPFIKDYFEWVREVLGDPADTRRLTPTALLRNLHAHQQAVYERLLKVSGDDSILGYAETDIILKDGQEFYSFPGNFRQMLAKGFERRLDGDPKNVVDRLRSVPPWSRDRGLVILSPEQGFKVQPVPVLDSNQTWTLRYQRRPIVLHWGEHTIENPWRPKGGNTFKLASNVPAEQGSVVKRVDYYKGEMLHIVEADEGADQSVEVTGFNPGTLELALRYPLTPAPKGRVVYEFRTPLPRGMDKLYALSVGLSYTASRTDPDKRKLMKEEFRELLAAAKNYFRTTTADRPPSTNHSLGGGTVDPFAM